MNHQCRLIVFFGFINPNKGAEYLFEIADPAIDQLVFVGQLDFDSAYGRILSSSAESETWRGKVNFLGFLPPEDVSMLLSLADAVVLPFRDGGGEWNSTIHAAVQHGCFVLTTTTNRERVGYDDTTNVFYGPINDIGSLRQALRSYAGVRFDRSAAPPEDWDAIALRHLRLYSSFRVS